MSGYTLAQIAIWSSMRDELTYAVTLPSFLAAASIAAQSWSRVKYLPSWLSFSHCSSGDSAASAGGASVAGATAAGASVAGTTGAGASVAGKTVAGSTVGVAAQLAMKLNSTSMVISLTSVFISFSLK